MPGFQKRGGGVVGGDFGIDTTVEDIASADDFFNLDLDLANDINGAGDGFPAIGLTTIDVVGSVDANTVVGSATLADVSRSLDAVEGVVLAFCTRDTYLRRDTPSTSYGTQTTMQAKQNTPVVNDDRNAYIGWDFSTYSGLSASSSNISIHVGHGSPSAQPLTVEAYTHPTAPFTNTSTWGANEQPPGTLVLTADTVSVPSGTPVYVSLPAQAQVACAQAIQNGHWFYVRVRGNQSAGGDLITFTISSVESGTPPFANFRVNR